MSEAIVGSSVIDISDKYGGAPLALARMLGNEAIASELIDRLDGMEEFIKTAALQGLMIFATALKASDGSRKAAGSGDIQTVRLVTRLDIQDIITEPSELLEPQAGASAMPEVTVSDEPELAHANALNFAESLFSDARAQEITSEMVPRLLAVIRDLYVPKNNKKESALRQIERLELFLNGKGDKEIAQVYGLTPTGINLGRRKIRLIIQREYPQAELIEALDSLFTEHDMPLFRSEGAIARILQENNISAQTDMDSENIEQNVRTQLDIALETAERSLSNEELESLKALLELSDTTVDLELIRNHLQYLMQQHAPRYYPELGISNLQWNIMNDLIGFNLEQGKKPVTASMAAKRNETKLSLYHKQFEDEVGTILLFLLGKEFEPASSTPARKIPFLR